MHLLLIGGPAPDSNALLWALQLLLSLTDNWQQTGGADEFVRWAGSGDHESFFTDARAKQLYKQHVTAVLSRKNSINGRRYSEDPTIFGMPASIQVILLIHLPMPVACSICVCRLEPDQ